MRCGIEKEGLRALPSGGLALTPHPLALGSALTHPLITTDYSESQLELITGAHRGVQQCLDELTEVHQFVHHTLKDSGELLWASSMPCGLPTDETIPLARYGSSNIGRAKSVYRMGLGHRYGRRMQTISGIHYNWSLPGVDSGQYFALIRNFRRHAFVLLLAGLLGTSLPPPGLWPAASGLGLGLTLLFAFGMPPLLQLARVPPLRVIRRDLGGIKPASLAVLALGLAGFAALLLAVSRDLLLGLIAVGGFAGAAALFAGLSWLAVKLLRHSVNEVSAPRWLVLATRQIAARPAYAVVQVSSLALGLLALVLLVLLRTDLISSWRQATPPDAPDRFVINVQPGQSAAFRQALADSGVLRYDWYPMIRGRLVAVNGQAVGPERYADERAKRLVERELNLSNTLEQPAHNQIVAGQWRPGEAGAISVEEGIAKTLGLRLGDRLRFDIGGVQDEARITSLRKVDWGSMRANFFVIYPVAQLEESLPLTYLAAYRAPAAPGFDNALVRQFPNITSVDMGATIAQVQRVLDQVIHAVEFLFAFTLAAGLVVLFAAVTATREERAREYAIMRAVGASARLLRQVQRAELAGVGLLAGFLASAVALALGWALARFVFDFSWTAAPWVPLAGAGAGAVLALAAGWWGLREVLLRPVTDTLRRSAE
ncbi:FtsX-like permease family protein [Verminephrobacter sp. Larva24]|nr:FtsX-like permease family protein [Verminephrobacter sp. Larva24]